MTMSPVSNKLAVEHKLFWVHLEYLSRDLFYRIVDNPRKQKYEQVLIYYMINYVIGHWEMRL